MSHIDALQHWIAHKMGWNQGKVVTFYHGEQLMVGFRCYGCGKIFNIGKAEHEPGNGHSSTTTSKP